ncbi:hypothetical protein J0910_18910 [Nocardiopsis sp. CNT-189]|uniref:hypothetical protein n=1 Tax=Nocardiopsis oceanisediminis TaxID=2816862 RepID=UPI003B34EC40
MLQQQTAPPEAVGVLDGLTADALPDWTREPVLLGCHGGAGTTTLRALLDSPWDLGAFAAERKRIGTYGRPLVLVTRNTSAASAQTGPVLGVLEANGIRPAALVVVADGAGPEPAEAAARFRLAEERVLRTVRFPFVAGLRFVDTADVGRVRLPRRAQRALEEITAACRDHAAHLFLNAGDD